MSDNYIKYLKYKNKYLKLKKLVGGIEPMTSNVIPNHNYIKDNIITIPSSVKTINDDAFKNNKLIKLIIKGYSLKNIGSNAFSNNNLEIINIPSSVETIGDNAFSNNVNLQIATIPNKFEKDLQRIFGNYKIFKKINAINNIFGYITIKISNDIVKKERDDKEKLDKEKLDKEKLDKEKLDKEKLDKEKFDKEKLDKEKLDKEKLDKEIQIGKNNILKREMIEEKREKDNVERKEKRRLIKEEEERIKKKEEIEEEIEEKIKKEKKKIDPSKIIHNGDADKYIIKIPKSPWGSMIYEFENLPCEYIEENTFSNKKIEARLDLPLSIKIIDTKAFMNNEFKILNIPLSLIYIGESAFNKNTLYAIDILQISSLIYIGNNAFDNNKLVVLDLSYLSSLIYIGNYAFSNNKLVQVIIPISVEIIGNNAFNNNPELEHVTISKKFKPDIQRIFNNQNKKLNINFI